jgi:hypothetical protein
MRDLEERLKQALKRIWGLEDEIRALRSRIERVEQVETFEQPDRFEQPRAVT